MSVKILALAMMILPNADFGVTMCFVHEIVMVDYVKDIRNWIRMDVGVFGCLLNMLDKCLI